MVSSLARATKPSQTHTWMIKYTQIHTYISTELLEKIALTFYGNGISCVQGGLTGCCCCTSTHTHFTSLVRITPIFFFFLKKLICPSFYLLLFLVLFYKFHFVFFFSSFSQDHYYLLIFFNQSILLHRSARKKRNPTHRIDPKEK